MKWFVYWSIGGCQYGDHDWGLEEFDTEEAAVERIQEICPTGVGKYDAVSLIHGTLLPIEQEKPDS